MTRTRTADQIDADYAASCALSEALTARLRAAGWKKRQNVMDGGTRRVTRLFVRGGGIAIMLFEDGAERRAFHVESSDDLDAFLEIAL